MKTMLFLVVALACHNTLFAQDKNFVTVKAGNKVSDVLKREDIFYFPNFKKGRVHFRDGSKGEAKLNYNCLVEEMQFIDPNRDTLSLADEKTIRFISIDTDTFYYSQGYLRLIASNKSVKLAAKQAWNVHNVKKIGAYGTANATAAITSFSSVAGETNLYNLVINEDMDLRKDIHYYFGDAYNNKFVLASKKSLLSLFPKKQRDIEAYLNENKTDFTKKEDLEKIVDFIGLL